MNPLDNIRIVLVNPLYGGNAGSVCRAMMNMGLSDLALVAPRNLDEQEARTMAYRAVDLWERRRVFDTLAEAVADCGLIAGTTAREGLYRSHSKTPREWAPFLLEGAERNRVAVVFGPEDRGLTNEDLALCTQVIQIPSTEAYLSLNLAQAVMVCCYELYVASGRFEARQEKSPLASTDVRERMFGLWREMLLAAGFMEPEKADHMMLGIRRIFARSPLTEIDVNILMGIARQVMWYTRRHESKDAPPEFPTIGN